MEIEVLARFREEVQKTAEEIEDDRINELIGKALYGQKTIKVVYKYDPCVFEIDEVYTYVKLDDKHTSIKLKDSTVYNINVPYENWLVIYQQLRNRNIMRISYSDMEPQPVKRKIRKPNVKE